MVIAKQPLGIAFLATGAFESARDANPQVTDWFVGGHSLGGTVAAMDAEAHDGDTTAPVKGLILYASYPASDMSTTLDAKVLSVSGTKDGLATPADIEASRANLPAGAIFTPIEGAVHSFFGDYGPQPGDAHPRSRTTRPVSSSRGTPCSSSPACSAMQVTDERMMHLSAFADAVLPDDVRRQVARLQEAAWPLVSDEPALTCESARAPHTLVLDDEGVVLAALEVPRTSFEHAGTPLAAAGLSAVVTRASERRRGHATRLAAFARSWLATQPVDLGIFTCDREISRVYTAAGWQVLSDAVLVGGTPEAPFPSDQAGWDKVVLIDLFSERAAQLRPTFEGARIALYPGPDDRLW